MRTYQHPIYQDNTMAIRAEYDEEKRVFDLMKKFLYIVGAITAIVVFLLLLVNSPDLQASGAYREERWNFLFR